MTSAATTGAERVVRRVRHEIKRRDVEVRRIVDRSPHLRAIVFGGEALADFVSESFDDHVKVILDVAAAEPVARDYTPRSYDPAARELTIEFVLHGTGPASLWAARAKPGDRIVIGGPRSSMIIPAGFDWHLLVGDLSAVPAIGRRLAELPAGARAIAIVQADDADRPAFDTAADLALQWVATADECIAAVRSLALPDGDGYAWCASDAGTVKALRHVIVDEKGLDRHRVRAAAYWKHGLSAHHENLE